MVKRLINILQIASVYIGTVIGAGFATGREVVQFFTQYGYEGLIGILIAGYCFIYLGTKIMILSIDYNITSLDEFNDFLYGKHVSRLVTIFMIIILFGVSAVMFAGAEALFNEQLDISRGIGSLITGILLFIILLFGMRGLFIVNGVVVPLIIVFTIIIFIQTVDGQMIQMMKDYQPLKLGKVILSGFSYGALNITLAQAILIPIANDIKNPTSIKLGGIIGGILLTILLICIHFNLMTIVNIDQYEIPVAVIVKGLSTFLLYIYIFIVFAEIFTSLLANIYGIERYVEKYMMINKNVLFCILIVSVYSISVVNYSMLLSILYPIFGYMSLITLIMLMIKKNKNTTIN